jgi:hypothetical protein
MNTAIRPQAPAIAPDHIRRHHWQEWIDSAVDPGVISLNVRSLEGDQALEYLLYAAMPNRGHAATYVTAGSKRILKQYAHCAAGGWWVDGVGEFSADSQWGQFKPDQPRAGEKGGFIKYEAPPQADLQVLFLRVTYAIGQKIADRAGLGSVYSLRQCPSPNAEDTDFWSWAAAMALPLVITEGAKKAGALLSAGYLGVSLSGIWTGVRTHERTGFGKEKVRILPKLVPELAHWAAISDSMVVAFDYEPRQKQRIQMDKAIAQLGESLSFAQCKLQIIQLPGLAKGVDDFIVEHGTGEFDLLAIKAVPYLWWKAQELGKFTYPANQASSSRYLGPLNLPEDASFVLVRAPKGAGKSYAVKPVCDEHTSDGGKVMAITHRVQLGQEQCNKLGIPFAAEHWDAPEGTMFGYGLCIDSMHSQSGVRYDASIAKGAIIILDEVVQFVWHLLHSITAVADRRMEILQNLRDTLQIALTTGGKVICMDADLDDLTVQFILNLSGLHTIKPYVITNDHKSETPKVVNTYNKPEDLLNAIFTEATAQSLRPEAERQALMITTQSQKAKSRHSTRTLEAVVKQHLPGLRVVRVDSKTVANPNHDAYRCTENVNEFVKQWDVIIVSPTWGTGVSIDLVGKFAATYHFCQGVTDVDSTRQSIARVREAVPRHIWCNKRGVSKISNGATKAYKIRKREEDLGAANSGMMRQVFRSIKNMDLPIEDLIADMVALKTWSEFAARINCGQVDYRYFVLAGLEQEGYRVQEGFASFDECDLKELITTTRNQLKQAECEGVSDANRITDQEAKKLEKRKEKTEAEEQQLQRYRLEKRYLTEDVSPELVERDGDGWYGKLLLLYYANTGRAFVDDRDLKTVNPEQSTVWLPDFNKKLIGLKVRLLEALDFAPIMQSEVQYHKDHEALIAFKERCLTHGRKIDLIFGTAITAGMTPIQVAQTMLAKIDCKLTYQGRFGARGQTVRTYLYVAPTDDRDAIFDRWLQRDIDASFVAEESDDDMSVSTPSITYHYTEEAA